jgi:poly(A) polymerase
MIKRFIRRVLGLPSETLQRVPRETHGLGRDAISPSAAKVCTALREAGFSAYVVGGAVRDLLLGIAPEDFDIATDARPEQIRPLFRRALIIGRRFRLVHVMLGGDTVEVSTFRDRREGRARPGAARQRVRYPGGGRAAPRLHRERAVLRPG